MVVMAVGVIVAMGMPVPVIMAVVPVTMVGVVVVVSVHGTRPFGDAIKPLANPHPPPAPVSRTPIRLPNRRIRSNRRP